MLSVNLLLYHATEAETTKKRGIRFIRKFHLLCHGIAFHRSIVKLNEHTQQQPTIDGWLFSNPNKMCLPPLLPVCISTKNNIPCFG